jgi:hypothetical protein
VVIELERLDPDRLPAELAVSALTVAELATGPHAACDPDERARRQDRLQRADAGFDPLPFDSGAAKPTVVPTLLSPAPAARLVARVRSISPSQPPPARPICPSARATPRTSALFGASSR